MNLESKITVNASAQEAWQVLGEQFGTISEWSAALQSSSLNGELQTGAVRTCTSSGFGPFPPTEAKEQLTHYDPNSLEFSYTALSGLPKFIKEASNAWSIQTVDAHQCIVYSRAKVKLAWWLTPLAWLFPLLLKKDMKKFIEELVYRIENGRPHPRNNATSIKV